MRIILGYITMCLSGLRGSRAWVQVCTNQAKEDFQNPVSHLALLSKPFVSFENLDNCKIQRRIHKYMSNSHSSFPSCLLTTFLWNCSFFPNIFHELVMVTTRSSLVLFLSYLLNCLTIEMLWLRLLRKIRNEDSSEQQGGRKSSIIKL